MRKEYSMVSILVRQNPFVVEEPQYRYIGEKMGDEIAKAVGIKNTRQLQYLALDVRDVFYYPFVQLKPKENLIPQLQPIWDIVASAQRYKENMAPDNATVANRELSESAAVVFLTSVLLKLKQENEEVYNKVVEALENPDIEKKQREQEAKEAQQKKEGQKTQQQQGSGQCQTGIPQQIQQIDKAINDAAARSINKVREFVETEKEIERVINMIKTAGKQAGVHGRSRLDQRELEQLALNAKVRELLKYLSETKILSIVASKLNKYEQQTPELTGIAKGSKLENVLPSELVYPEEELYRRWVEGQLLLYEKSKQEKKMIYTLLDISGSMAGTKELWSKALALSLLIKAQKFGYQYCYRFFEFETSEKVCIPPSDVEKEFITIASKGVGGGTDITKAILKALDDLKGVKGVMKTIYLITDGEDQIDVKQIADKLAETKSFLISIMVEGDNPSLREVSIKYFSVELTPQGILDIVKV